MSSVIVPHPLPEPLVDVLSERMALLGHPSRIRILDVLRDGERNVQAIADALTTTQQNVSGHLRLLLAAGVVSRKPVGREVFYRVVDESVWSSRGPAGGGPCAARGCGGALRHHHRHFDDRRFPRRGDGATVGS
jgi:DNA-binding transcriptional ArsR family regulator